MPHGRRHRRLTRGRHLSAQNSSVASRPLPARLLAVATLSTSMVVAALCGAVSTPAGGAAPTSTPLSIVQLGDSIASGEGTLYQAPNAASPNGQLYFCLSSSDPSSNCYSYLHGYYNGYWMDWPSTSPARWTPAGSPTYPGNPTSRPTPTASSSPPPTTPGSPSCLYGASYLAGVTGLNRLRRETSIPPPS